MGGRVRGGFPGFLSKTDEIRVQVLEAALERPLYDGMVWLPAGRLGWNQGRGLPMEAGIESQAGYALLSVPRLILLLLCAAQFVFYLSATLDGPVEMGYRQSITPDRLLGRVNSAYRLFAWGTQPIGALLGGVIGELFGLPAVFVLAGLASLTLILMRAIITERALVDAEAEGAAASA